MTKKINTNDDKKQGLLNEPANAYTTQQNHKHHIADEYMSLEEFRIEAQKRAKQFLLSHGIHK